MIPIRFDAIASLKPGADFVLTDNVLEWRDTKQTKPTESEIDTELSRLITEYNNKKYQRDRLVEYPSIPDQLDDIYHNAPACNITLELLDDCGADYSLHSVEDPNNYVAELTEAGHGELVAKGKVHFLSYTKYHSTDIINTIKDRFNLK